MQHILVVANQTIGSPELTDAMRERLASGPCRFTLLVPTVVPSRDFAGNFGSTFVAGGMTGLPTYETGTPRAQARLGTGLEWLRRLGASADGEVGDEDAVLSVVGLVAANEFEEIIVSTLPRTVSRWLHQDLPHQIRRRVDVPVTVVTAAKAVAG